MTDGASRGPDLALVVAGTRGDLQPFLALARALRAAGARPRLLTHLVHRPAVMAAGVPFVELPGNPQEFLMTDWGQDFINARNPLQLLTSLRRGATALIDDIISALESGLKDSDLVVFSPMGVVAYHVAESLGIPSAWGALQPLTRTTAWPSLLVSPARDLGWANRYTYTVAERLQWWLFGTSVDSYRRGAGLKPYGRRGPFREIEQSLPVLCGWSPALLPAPPDWSSRVSVTGRWHLPSDGRLPTELDNFLDAGPPPVYIGLGSMTVQSPDVTTRMLVSAARELGARIVLSRGWTGLGGGIENGQDICIVDEVPHDALFGRCAAVVHHAGAGTTQSVAAAGVPGVPLPFFGDQPFWARLTAERGIASDPVPKHRWSTDRIAASLAQALLEPWRAERARSIARQMADEHGAEAAAAQLLELLL